MLQTIASSTSDVPLSAPNTYSFRCKPSTQCLERLRCLKQATFNRHIKTIDWTSDLDDEHHEDESNLGERVTIFRDIVLASPNVTTLGALNLRYETFANRNYNLEFARACEKLTYIDLKFFASETDFEAWINNGEYRVEFQQNLRGLLAHTNHLTILQLSFGPEIYWHNEHMFASHGLWHILPPNKVWPNLSHLELNYIAITEKDISQLLAAHSTTLLCLHLRGIILFEPDLKMGHDWFLRGTKMRAWRKTAWRGVFEEFERMERVEQIIVEDITCVPRGNDDGKLNLRSRSGKEIRIETNLKKCLVGET